MKTGIALPASISQASGLTPQPSQALPSWSSSLQGPQAPQAPLHDIVGPFSFFAYTSIQIFIALLFFCMVAGVLFWGIRKLRQKPPLTPREACLQKLLKMKKNLMEGSDHDFGSLVSGVLRGYLGTAFGLAAPRQTTEEFLASLRGHTRFTAVEQKSIEVFLTRSDFLKFAHGKATEQERLSLIAAAEQFIQGELSQENKNKEEVIPS